MKLFCILDVCAAYEKIKISWWEMFLTDDANMTDNIMYLSQRSVIFIMFNLIYIVYIFHLLHGCYVVTSN